MAGRAYQSTRSALDRFARETGQPEARIAARQIIEVLDDGMERSLQQLNPGELGAWQQARGQYRNMIVVEQSATGAGEAAAEGLISPPQLRQATVSKHGRRNYARGQGPYAELARAGAATMQEMPNSGTASRAAARFLPNVVGGVLGGQLNSDGDFGSWAQGAAAGAAAPYLLGRGMMSRPGQAYLGNQVARNITPEMQQAIGRFLTMSGTTSLLGYQ
jgi:hypothetical protein